MSYFDSEKNRAIWSKRLQALEQERERRRQHGFSPKAREREAHAALAESSQKPGTKVITLQELIEKEEARHLARKAEANQQVRQRTQVRGMDAAARVM